MIHISRSLSIQFSEFVEMFARGAPFRHTQTSIPADNNTHDNLMTDGGSRFRSIDRSVMSQVKTLHLEQEAASQKHSEELRGNHPAQSGTQLDRGTLSSESKPRGGCSKLTQFLRFSSAGHRMGGDIIARMKQAYTMAEKTAKKANVSREAEVAQHKVPPCLENGIELS